jgi:HTH-type transcriptional regulator/antitoxin HigA
METPLLPARATPPGRILRRELEARTWSQQDLASILGRPTQAISEIIGGTKAITPETAVALGAAFGTSAEFWASLESNYRVALARRTPQDEVARKARIYDYAPVRELIKRGWLPSVHSAEDLERAVLDFFRISDLSREPKLSVSLRSSAHGDGTSLAAQRAWVRRVEQHVEGKKLPPYDQRRLAEAIPALRRLAGDPAAVAAVPTMLEELGVAFVVVRHLSGTKLDGAAAFVQGTPTVALTMRFDRIDYFWFTLFHEIAHLVLGHDGGHLDVDASTDDIDEEERAANAMAAGWLLGAELEALCERSPRLSKKAIEAFAEQHHIHPGLVVGRLQGMNRIPYSQLRGLLVKVAEHLAPWNVG